MGHNFLPALMVVVLYMYGLTLQYILSKFFPIPFAYIIMETQELERPRNWKDHSRYSAVAWPSLGLILFTPRPHWRSTHNCAPTGIFHSVSTTPSPELLAVSDLTLALSNGAKGATIKRGEKAPSCMPATSPQTK